MPSFSDVTQSDWGRACRRLGLIVETKREKGSHILVKHPVDGRKYTIQNHLHKYINQKIFKKMVEWGFSEKEIWNAL